MPHKITDKTSLWVYSITNTLPFCNSKSNTQVFNNSPKYLTFPRICGFLRCICSHECFELTYIGRIGFNLSVLNGDLGGWFDSVNLVCIVPLNRSALVLKVCVFICWYGGIKLTDCSLKYIGYLRKTITTNCL